MPSTLKEFIQEKPFGIPLHSALVHFPIGLFTLSLILDIATYIVSGSHILFLGAFYTMVFGAVMADPTALTGLIDWWDIRVDHPAKKTATIHMVLNLTAIVLYLLNILLRATQLELTTPPLLILGLSLAGMGLLGVSGYLGGTLVYDNGIAVGKYRRRMPVRPMSRTTIYVASKEAKDGYVEIRDGDQLREGETLRVSCDGVEMAIVKMNGEVYAFQDYCTHRFAPSRQELFTTIR